MYFPIQVWFYVLCAMLGFTWNTPHLDRFLFHHKCEAQAVSKEYEKVNLVVVDISWYQIAVEIGSIHKSLIGANSHKNDPTLGIFFGNNPEWHTWHFWYITHGVSMEIFSNEVIIGVQKGRNKDNLFDPK